MQAFEDLYNSTIKLVKGGSTNVDPTVKRSTELNHACKAGSTELNRTCKAGAIDLTTRKATPVEKHEIDYSKIDPVNIYRNKVSLKKEPYDVNKVKYLYNKTTPSSESFTSFIKKAETKANVESRYYKNFVRWMDSSLRKILWDSKCATGMCRIPLENIGGIGIQNVYQLIDFDYNIVWEYAIYENGKYVIVGQAARTKGDEIAVKYTNQIAAYKKARKISGQKHYKKYTEGEFYGNAQFEKFYTTPNVYEIVDRDSVEYSNISPTVLKQLFEDLDPILPKLRSGSLKAYNDYVAKQTAAQPALPEEEKKIETATTTTEETPEKQ